ncbi:MAG: hypothetical protein QMD44_08705 [Thermodesulfovibrionales bacterium]|jgi:c-di-AMP phosphodiesterase-like protein|nr:hypothetical protein [Thermodesulfovibrionales bacterium]
MEKPSRVEKISDNLIVETGMTALAFFAATPLTALLPVLTKSLAYSRYKKRVKKALSEIEQKLTKHEEKLRNLSDAQYKIINEIILTILQTTEDEKIAYLQKAVSNCIEEETVSVSFVSQISRILRDISVEELRFLVKYHKRSRIVFNEKTPKEDELSVEVNSDEGILISGLIALGLLVPGAATFDEVGQYHFSPLVEKVLKVIGVP